MKTALRFVLGAALVYLAACVAVFVLGFVVVHLPCCTVPLAVYDSLVFVPFALFAAVILERLFPVRPFLNAVLCVSAFALVQVADVVVQSPHSAMDMLRGTAHLFLIFLVGIPAAVYVIERLRSNNRWRGP